PDHPSGYNCVTGSFMHAAKSFFGHDKVGFSLVKITPGSPDVTRSYEKFTDVIDDTIDARILLGIHFRTPDVQGAELGEDVARWLAKHFLEPR
ncbi:MAG: PA-phosphatase, partial [Acidimicrobiia bacterium]